MLKDKFMKLYGGLIKMAALHHHFITIEEWKKAYLEPGQEIEEDNWQGDEKINTSKDEDSEEEE